MDRRSAAAWPTMPRPSLMRMPLDLGRVAGLEAHAQVAGAVVDQQDGEDAVVDDGAHQVGDAMHQRVQVERGVQRVGKAHQEVDLQRLEADVGRAEARLGASPGSRRLDLRGPVVALEGSRRRPRGRSRICGWKPSSMA